MPISSDGHLVTLQVLLGRYVKLELDNLSFDILVHFATLLVVVLFLRKDILFILTLLINPKKTWKEILHFSIPVIIATLPAVVVGLFLYKQVKSTFDSVAFAASGFLITSAFLFLAQRKINKTINTDENEARDDTLIKQWPVPTYLQSLIIGCGQAFAVLPGVSRSGLTIAIACLLGLNPRFAVKFSLLMALPAISGAVVLSADEILSLDLSSITPYLLGSISAFLSGLFAIKFLVKSISRRRLKGFAIYTAVLGIGLHLYLFLIEH